MPLNYTFVLNARNNARNGKISALKRLIISEIMRVKTAVELSSIVKREDLKGIQTFIDGFAGFIPEYVIKLDRKSVV